MTVQDGHPHTLSFLAGARGDRIRCLGVTDFGQSSDLADAYALHGIDTATIRRTCRGCTTESVQATRPPSPWPTTTAEPGESQPVPPVQQIDIA